MHNLCRGNRSAKRLSYVLEWLTEFLYYGLCIYVKQLIQIGAARIRRHSCCDGRVIWPCTFV
jgi:hypothetical protein